MLRSAEKLHIPPAVAGIGFPPSTKVSLAGLLSTNPESAHFTVTQDVILNFAWWHLASSKIVSIRNSEVFPASVTTCLAISGFSLHTPSDRIVKSEA